MSGAEVLLWPLAALIVFGALRYLARRRPGVRPWLPVVAVAYLAGFVAWSVATPGEWRRDAAVAVVIAYAIWVGAVARDRAR